jgi:hypothetical protein
VPIHPISWKVAEIPEHVLGAAEPCGIDLAAGQDEGIDRASVEPER